MNGIVALMCGIASHKNKSIAGVNISPNFKPLTKDITRLQEKLITR